MRSSNCTSGHWVTSLIALFPATTRESSSLTHQFVFSKAFHKLFIWLTFVSSPKVPTLIYFIPSIFLWISLALTHLLHCPNDLHDLSWLPPPSQLGHLPYVLRCSSTSKIRRTLPHWPNREPRRRGRSHLTPPTSGRMGGGMRSWSQREEVPPPDIPRKTRLRYGGRTPKLFHWSEWERWDGTQNNESLLKIVVNFFRIEYFSRAIKSEILPMYHIQFVQTPQLLLILIVH